MRSIHGSVDGGAEVSESLATYVRPLEAEGLRSDIREPVKDQAISGPPLKLGRRE